MTYPVTHREQVMLLRGAGKTHREISEVLRVSISTVFLWVENVSITSEQKKAIESRRNRHRFTPEEKRRVVERLKRANTKYSRADLLEKIRSFYSAHGRIPLKREFNSWREYSKKFGSWNRAVTEAGFETNPVLFAKKFKAKDGHACDSFTEKVIDDWLFDNGIRHSRNMRYGKTKMTADFALNSNVILEFFGLAGAQKQYGEIVAEKRKLATALGLRLLEIYPRDIYPINKLSKLLER